MFRFTTLVLAVCLAAVPVFSQSAPQPSRAANPRAQEKPAGMHDPQQYVTVQFGPAYNLLPGYPVMTADLDGDGTEDAVFAVTAKNPLLDEAEYHYRTIDPYNTYFGFGDPRVTIQFAAQEGAPRLLAIVHDWRAETPKAKFVIINLPFEELATARIAVKKKVLPCIVAKDRTGAVSSVYWNGKEYKWVDGDLAQP